jgi:hypothetical protein
MYREQDGKRMGDLGDLHIDLLWSRFSSGFSSSWFLLPLLAEGSAAAACDHLISCIFLLFSLLYFTRQVGGVVLGSHQPGRWAGSRLIRRYPLALDCMYRYSKDADSFAASPLSRFRKAISWLFTPRLASAPLDFSHFSAASTFEDGQVPA